MNKKSRIAVLKSMILATMLLAASGIDAQPAKGANKFLGNITTRNAVRSDFLTYWNQITGENEHKWASVEGTRDRMNWGGGDNIANFAKQNGITWKFHTLVWGSQYPSWMNSLSQADQLKQITEWFDETKKHYPDIPMIDVVNEAYEANGGKHAPPPWKNALGGNGSTGFDYIIKAFQMARERWPKAILIYNDYNNCEYGNEVHWTVKLMEAMKKAKAPVDAIGCQAHDAWKIPTATVKSNLDKLAATGYPIFITEYDIGESNDAKQKQIMQEQFTMFWNHPKIVGITYWGYLVGATWRNGTGLLNTSGSERPALTWLKEYVKNNPNPPNDFPNLLKNGGGLNTSAKETIIKNQATQMRINQNGSLINVTLQPNDNEQVVLNVYDLKGKIVRSESLNAGSHTCSFNTSGMSNGYYVVKALCGNSIQKAGFVLSGR